MGQPHTREARLRRHRACAASPGTANGPACSCSDRTAHRRAAGRRRRRAHACRRVVEGAGRIVQGDKTEQAAEVGKRLASAAKNAGVEVVVSTVGVLYHGRVTGAR